MAANTPVLTLQTASLYASGPGSTFTGTGGPFGFSPFTGQFGGVINSAGLAAEPFADTVYNVAAGDEVTFVIAVQNATLGAPANNVRLRDFMPTGFVQPVDGIGLTVTDGLGNDLPISGDLFSAAGLLINAPLLGYDPSSGQNLALVTFSLTAGSAVPGPYATLLSRAVLAGYTASAAGPDLAAANPASATTTVVTSAPTPVVTPETDPTAVAVGQTIAFDVTVSVPAGSLSNFTISPILPAGLSSLLLVSSSVVSIGSALQTGRPVIELDGSIAFGTVTLAAGAIGSSTIVTRVVVRAEGTVSGRAILQTTVSAGDATSAGGIWTANVSSSVGVVTPPAPPTLSGLVASQVAIIASHVKPFSSLSISDNMPASTGNIAITLLDPTLGRFSVPDVGSLDPTGTTFAASGSLSILQAAARQLVFTPSAMGLARFTVTVVDAAGGVAQNTGTAVTVGTPQLTPNPLFDATYYLAQYPDVAAAGVNPLLHYETDGWREGRNPSASFDTNDYLAAYADVKAAGVDPLLHYALYGRSEGRAEFAVPSSPPNPLVNAAYLYAVRPDVAAAGVDATVWFNTFGWKEGVNPDAYFDTNYYLAQNPDVRAAGVNPLQHFEAFGWKEGRDPSLVFSDSKYLAASPDVAAAAVNPLLHYVANGQTEGRMTFLTGGARPADLLVNAAYYDVQLGATLIPTGAAGAQQAAYSYNATGWQNGRNPDAFFNTTYYLSHNPDVAAAHVDPLLHYETYGWQEGRDPSAAFSTNKYLAAYPDVKAAGVDPLVHYVQYGQAEGRQSFNV